MLDMKLVFSNRRFVRHIAAAFALLGASGCASVGPLRNDLAIETESGSGVIIQSATARATESGTMIAGLVRRAFGYGPIYRSHLDIEVIAADGSVQRQVATRYNPTPIPRSHRFRRDSHYAMELPLTPVSGSTIRVSHHRTSIQACPTTQTILSRPVDPTKTILFRP